MVEGEVYDFNSEIICTVQIKNWGTGVIDPDNIPAQARNPDGKVGLEVLEDGSRCWVVKNSDCSTSSWAVDYLAGASTSKQHGKLTQQIYYPISGNAEILSVNAIMTIYVPAWENPMSVPEGYTRPFKFSVDVRRLCDY